MQNETNPTPSQCKIIEFKEYEIEPTWFEVLVICCMWKDRKRNGEAIKRLVASPKAVLVKLDGSESQIQLSKKNRGKTSVIEKVIPLTKWTA